MKKKTHIILSFFFLQFTLKLLQSNQTHIIAHTIEVTTASRFTTYYPNKENRNENDQ